MIKKKVVENFVSTYFLTCPVQLLTDGCMKMFSKISQISEKMVVTVRYYNIAKVEIGHFRYILKRNG